MRKTTRILLTYITINLLLMLAGQQPLFNSAQAQRINAYVTAGGITSQIEGDELKGFSHWGFTGGVGAVAALDDNDRWSLAVEAGYSGRGVYNNNHNVQNPYNINVTLHYVDIPLTVFFKDPYGGLRIGVGMVYSRLVQQPHGTIRYNPDYFIPDTTDMSFLKNDLAPAIEVKFTIWSHLQMSIRYQYSLLPVKKDWKFTEGEKDWTNNCYNSAASFRLIWQFGDEDRKSRHKSHYKPRQKKKRKW